MNVEKPVWMELGGKRIKLANPLGESIDLFVIIGTDTEEIAKRYATLLTDVSK